MGFHFCCLSRIRKVEGSLGLFFLGGGRGRFFFLPSRTPVGLEDPRSVPQVPPALSLEQCWTPGRPRAGSPRSRPPLSVRAGETKGAAGPGARPGKLSQRPGAESRAPCAPRPVASPHNGGGQRAGRPGGPPRPPPGPRPRAARPVPGGSPSCRRPRPPPARRGHSSCSSTGSG